MQNGLSKTIEIKKPKEEKIKENEIEENEVFFLQKMNISTYMTKMNTPNLDFFFTKDQMNHIVYLDQNTILQENEKKMLENEEIKKFMDDNLLSIVKTSTLTEKIYSHAGELRKEYVKFYDFQYTEMIYKEKNDLEILFVHSNYPNINVI